MYILNTHKHSLVFHINKDAPDVYMNRWNTLKAKSESGENKDIIDQIKSFCRLSKNKNLPYLMRREGGMGGNDDKFHKQLRFRDYKLWSKLPKYVDTAIIIDRIECTDNEKWTYEELDDLIYGFIKTANQYVKAECVSGCILLKNETLFD